MFVLNKVNWFSLSVLINSPKRNKNTLGVAKYYLDTIIATILHKARGHTNKCDLVYIQSNKTIEFSKDGVRILYNDSGYVENYRIISDIGLLTGITIKNNIVSMPYYAPRRNIFQARNIGEELNYIGDSSYKLGHSRLRLRSGYVDKLTNRLDMIRIHDVDKYYYDLFRIEDDLPIYTTLVHGDLWRGNMVQTGKGFKIIDWDSMCTRSFSYDIFYYMFQEYDADLKDYVQDYKHVQNVLYPVMRSLCDKNKLTFSQCDYKVYYRVFIMERLCKRYEHSLVGSTSNRR